MTAENSGPLGRPVVHRVTVPHRTGADYRQSPVSWRGFLGFFQENVKRLLLSGLLCPPTAHPSAGLVVRQDLPLGQVAQHIVARHQDGPRPRAVASFSRATTRRAAVQQQSQR